MAEETKTLLRTYDKSLQVHVGKAVLLQELPQIDCGSIGLDLATSTYPSKQTTS